MNTRGENRIMKYSRIWIRILRFMAITQLDKSRSVLLDIVIDRFVRLPESLTICWKLSPV